MELAYYFYTRSMFSRVFRWLSMLNCSIDLSLEGYPRKGSILRWCTDMIYIKMIGSENVIFPWDPFRIVMRSFPWYVWQGPNLSIWKNLLVILLQRWVAHWRYNAFSFSLFGYIRLETWRMEKVLIELFLKCNTSWKVACFTDLSSKTK